MLVFVFGVKATLKVFSVAYKNWNDVSLNGFRNRTEARLFSLKKTCRLDVGNGGPELLGQGL
jgi:hypothetical protein